MKFDKIFSLLLLVGVTTASYGAGGQDSGSRPLLPGTRLDLSLDEYEKCLDEKAVLLDRTELQFYRLFARFNEGGDLENNLDQKKIKEAISSIEDITDNYIDNQNRITGKMSALLDDIKKYRDAASSEQMDRLQLLLYKDIELGKRGKEFTDGYLEFLNELIRE